MRTYATIALYVAKNDDIAAASAAMALEPTRVAWKGDARGLIAVQKSGWFYSTQGIVADARIAAHLAFVLQILESREQHLHPLMENGLELRLYCFLEVANGNGGVVLDSALLKRLSRLPLDIHMDVYCTPDEG